jgi:hypothetical protein
MVVSLNLFRSHSSGLWPLNLLRLLSCGFGRLGSADGGTLVNTRQVALVHNAMVLTPGWASFSKGTLVLTVLQVLVNFGLDLVVPLRAGLPLEVLGVGLYFGYALGQEDVFLDLLSFLLAHVGLALESLHQVSFSSFKRR